MACSTRIVAFVSLVVFCTVSVGCATKLTFEKKDGTTDTGTEDTADPDLPSDLEDTDATDTTIEDTVIGDTVIADTLDDDVTIEDTISEDTATEEIPVEVCVEVATGPLQLSDDNGLSQAPTVTYNEADFIVLWQDDRGGDWEILLSNVDPAGTMGVSEVAVTNSDDDTISPSAFFGRDEINVAMSHDDSGTAGAWWLTVGGSGTVLDAPARLSEPGNEPALDPAIVMTISGYVMVWGNGTNVFSQRLNPSGFLVGANLLVEDNVASADSVTIAAGAPDLCVAWVDHRDGNPEIYAAILGADGNVLAGDIRLTTNATDSLAPAVTWDGVNFAVAWSDDDGGDDDIFMTWVSTAGVVVGTTVQVTDVTGDATAPTLAHDGANLALAWSDDSDGASTSTVRFLLLGSDGAAIVDPLAVTSGSSMALAPSLVSSPDGHGLAYQDDVDGDDEIYFAIIEQVSCS